MNLAAQRRTLRSIAKGPAELGALEASVVKSPIGEAVVSCTCSHVADAIANCATCRAIGRERVVGQFYATV